MEYRTDFENMSLSELESVFEQVSRLVIETKEDAHFYDDEAMSYDDESTQYEEDSPEWNCAMESYYEASNHSNYLWNWVEEYETDLEEVLVYIQKMKNREYFN